MRLVVTDAFETRVGGNGVQRPQVVDGHRQAAVADPLGAVREDLLAQHRMAHSKFGGCFLQTNGVDIGAVEFDVEVRGDTAELLLTVAADPHRVRDGSQREGRAGIVIGRGGHVDDGCGGCMLGHQFLPGPHRGGGGQRGEPDLDALFAPASGQRHHPDGVQAGGDEVGTRIQFLRRDSEQFCHLRANGV